MSTCALNDHLAHSLSCTHYVCRINRFIRGYHHKAFRTILLTKLHQILCAKYIVVNGFYTVMLHQWDMLVSGCIDNDLWMIFFKYSFKSFSMSDGTNFNLQIQLISICDLQFLLNIICTIFINI